MNKTTSLRIKRKNINRYISIIRDSLLPESTLQSVGNSWGITREGVRRIFLRATEKPYSVVRKDLLKNSTKYICPICGSPKDPRIKRNFCSPKCYRISMYYDWKHPKICRYCKGAFFPYRNWKASSINKNCLAGQYCCVKHYMLYHSKKGGRFSKDSTILKKFKHLGGGEKSA